MSQREAKKVATSPSDSVQETTPASASSIASTSQLYYTKVNAKEVKLPPQHIINFPYSYPKLENQ